MFKLVDRVRAIALTWEQVKAFVKVNLETLKGSENVFIRQVYLDGTRAPGDVLVRSLPLIVSIENIPFGGLTNCFLREGRDGGALNTGIHSVTTPLSDHFLFVYNLQIGSGNEDVFYLQQVLNSDPKTRLAEEGPGSPARETFFFGDLTKAALMKYQALHGIPQTGFFGPLTRAYMNSQQVSMKTHVVNFVFDTPVVIRKGQIKVLDLVCSISSKVTNGFFSWALADASDGYENAELKDSGSFVKTEFSASRDHQIAVASEACISSIWLSPLSDQTPRRVYLYGGIKQNTAYDVEISSDLNSWSSFGHIMPTEISSLQYAESVDASLAAAFFRLKELP